MYEQMDKLNAYCKHEDGLNTKLLIHDSDISGRAERSRLQSGKLVIQGKKTEDFVQDVLEAEIIRATDGL